MRRRRLPAGRESWPQRAVDEAVQTLPSAIATASQITADWRLDQPVGGSIPETSARFQQAVPAP